LKEDLKELTVMRDSANQGGHYKACHISNFNKEIVIQIGAFRKYYVLSLSFIFSSQFSCKWD
jgi:hypothetical protein